MFKRLLLLSGIIAFVLASCAMVFWYLPRQERIESTTEKMNQTVPDSVSVIPIDTISE